MRSAGNKNNIIQEVSDIFFKHKHIVARCHHDICKKNNVSWNQLYFAKTGEKYNTKDKRISESKNNGDKNVSLINVLKKPLTIIFLRHSGMSIILFTVDIMIKRMIHIRYMSYILMN